MPAKKTVYDHIWENKLKTIGLVLLFPVVMLALVWCGLWVAVYFSTNDPDFLTIGAQNAIDWFPSVADIISEDNIVTCVTLGYFIYLIVPILIFCGAWLTFVYFLGSSSLLSISNAFKADKTEYKQVHRAVENVAIMAGLPKPRVFIIDDESMNAFTTGARPQNATIALSKGLIEKLKPAELQAVIAHEMAHIGNRDVLLNLMLAEGIGVFAFLADVFRRFAFVPRRSGKGEGAMTLVFGLLSVLFLIFSYIVAPIIYLAVSRTREYNADATGAKIVHDPMALANALHKVGLDSRIEALGIARNAAMFCFVDPKYKCAHLIKTDSLFDTHPPIAKRIRRLKSMV